MLNEDFNQNTIILKPIGILGFAGSGKDTVANMIKERFKEYEMYSYADPLKKYCSEIFDIPLNYFYDRDKKDTEVKICVSTFSLSDEAKTVVNYTIASIAKNVERHAYGTTFIQSPRKIMQCVGTDYFRKKIDDKYWINKAPKRCVIIPDVRFANEAKHVIDNKGVLIRVTNPLIKSTDNHESEKQQLQIATQYDIVNSNVNCTTAEWNELHKNVNDLLIPFLLKTVAKGYLG